MKRSILLTGLLTVFSLLSFAKHVDEQTAKTVGQTFLATKTESPQLEKSKILTLAYKVDFSVAPTEAHKKAETRTFFYVFNAANYNCNEPPY